MGKMTRAFLGALIFALLAALILPAIFGEPLTFDDRRGGDPWRNFLYDFQTLITGMLAVGAAFATVWQMRVSDALQERRHRQIRYDARKGDFLAVQRLRDFLPSEARETARHLAAYLEAETPFGSALEWTHTLFAVRRLQEALQDLRVTSCFHLMPTVVVQLLEDCKREAGFVLQLESERKKLDFQQPDAIVSDDFLATAARQRAGNLGTKAAELADAVNKWALDFFEEEARSHT